MNKLSEFAHTLLLLSVPDISVKFLNKMNTCDIYFIRTSKYKISRESVSCGQRYSMGNYEATDGEMERQTVGQT